ncbi:hypothetical protein [Nonomuraea sp. SBT364]|uniref:hypothetical protein n=1 Tax=Nonomuraea sp. SBT364 TaxID=1580530 RepID=UPI00066EA853|nr:hypothetical protein [Nonomuraea sp. SBT364]
MSGLAVLLVMPTLAGALLLSLAGAERVWAAVAGRAARTWDASHAPRSVAHGCAEALLGAATAVALLAPGGWTMPPVLAQAALYAVFALVSVLRAAEAGRSCGCSALLDVPLRRRASPVFIRATVFAVVSASSVGTLSGWHAFLSAEPYGGRLLAVSGGAALALITFVFPYVRTPAATVAAPLN